MLATDWSQPSSNAVDALTGLKGLASDVIVVHNIGVKISKAMSPAQLQELKKESRRRLKEYCRRLTAAGLKAEFHLSSGRTAPEIINLSRQVQCIYDCSGQNREGLAEPVLAGRCFSSGCGKLGIAGFADSVNSGEFVFY